MATYKERVAALKKAGKETKRKHAEAKAKKPSLLERMSKGLKAKKVEKQKKAAPQPFGKAFSSARNAGKKTFTWKGKSYTTKTADDVKKEKAAKAKKPAPKLDVTNIVKNIAKSKAKKPTPKKVKKPIGQSYEVSPKGKTKEGSPIYTEADYEAQTPEEKSKWKSMEAGGKVEGCGEADGGMFNWPSRDARNGGKG